MSSGCVYRYRKSHLLLPLVKVSFFCLFVKVRTYFVEEGSGRDSILLVEPISIFICIEKSFVLCRKYVKHMTEGIPIGDSFNLVADKLGLWKMCLRESMYGHEDQVGRAGARSTLIDLGSI